MAIGDALDELIRTWPDLVRGLRPEAITSIRRELAAVVHGAPWDPAHLLSLALEGKPDDHPVWAALASTATRRDRAGSMPLEVSAMRLRFLIEVEARDQPDIGSQDDLDVETAAEERILLAPMTEPPDEVQGLELLVVPHHRGRLAPSFQFSASGQLLEHVREVNSLLGASDEPWGAASWWLSPHASLHGIPADLVRHDDPDAVVDAAAAASYLP